MEDVELGIEGSARSRRHHRLSRLREQGHEVEAERPSTELGEETPEEKNDQALGGTVSTGKATVQPGSDGEETVRDTAESPTKLGGVATVVSPVPTTLAEVDH